MLKRLSPLFIGAACLMASAAHAQSQPAAAQGAPTPVAPVTVEAAPGPATARKEARQFVQSYAASTPAIDQIARWRDPICIEVAGLVPEQEAQVAARIQQVATGVGMHVLKNRCRANIEVVFTDRAQAFMDQVARRREAVLGYFHRHDVDKLKTVSRPIQAWYVTSTQSVAGPSSDLETATIHGGPPSLGASRSLNYQMHDEVVDDPDTLGPQGCADAPHFTHCLTGALSNVLVVVDTSQLKGQDLGAVSDYVSMLALAQPRSLNGCATLSSVIDMLSPSCAGRDKPDGLTPADAAYLTSLYASDLEQNKAGEEDDISSRMAKILVRTSAGSGK